MTLPTLLPARAGMIPRATAAPTSPSAAPRTRGDDPFGPQYRVSPKSCSPHARG